MAFVSVDDKNNRGRDLEAGRGHGAHGHPDWSKDLETQKEFGDHNPANKTSKIVMMSGVLACILVSAILLVGTGERQSYFGARSPAESLWHGAASALKVIELRSTEPTSSALAASNANLGRSSIGLNGASPTASLGARWWDYIRHHISTISAFTAMPPKRELPPWISRQPLSGVTVEEESFVTQFAESALTQCAESVFQASGRDLMNKGLRALLKLFEPMQSTASQDETWVNEYGSGTVAETLRDSYLLACGGSQTAPTEATKEFKAFSAGILRHIAEKCAHKAEHAGEEVLEVVTAPLVGVVKPAVKATGYVLAMAKKAADKVEQCLAQVDHEDHKFQFHLTSLHTFAMKVMNDRFFARLAACVPARGALLDQDQKNFFKTVVHRLRAEWSAGAQIDNFLRIKEICEEEEPSAEICEHDAETLLRTVMPASDGHARLSQFIGVTEVAQRELGVRAAEDLWELLDMIMWQLCKTGLEFQTSSNANASEDAADHPFHAKEKSEFHLVASFLDKFHLAVAATLTEEVLKDFGRKGIKGGFEDMKSIGEEFAKHELNLAKQQLVAVLTRNPARSFLSFVEKKCGAQLSQAMLEHNFPNCSQLELVAAIPPAALTLTSDPAGSALAVAQTLGAGVAQESTVRAREYCGANVLPFLISFFQGGGREVRHTLTGSGSPFGGERV